MLVRLGQGCSRNVWFIYPGPGLYTYKEQSQVDKENDADNNMALVSIQP